MDLGALELQIFVSLVVVLGSAFVALICDYLKGNNEQLRERNIELRVRSEEQERFAILNPSAWLAQFRSAIAPAAAAAPPASPSATAEQVMHSFAPAEGLAQAAQREANLAERSAAYAPLENGVGEAPSVAGFDVAERRRSRRKRNGGEETPGQNSYDWVRPEVMARVARGAARHSGYDADPVVETAIVEEQPVAPVVAGEPLQIAAPAIVEPVAVAAMAPAILELPAPVAAVPMELQTEIERISKTEYRPSAVAPPVIMLRPLPALKLNEELQRVAEQAKVEPFSSQLLDDVIAASAAKPFVETQIVVETVTVEPEVEVVAVAEVVEEVPEVMAEPVYEPVMAVFAEAAPAPEPVQEQPKLAMEELPFPMVAFEPPVMPAMPEIAASVEELPAYSSFPVEEYPTYDALPPVVETPAYDWAQAEFAPLPDPIFINETYAEPELVAAPIELELVAPPPPMTMMMAEVEAPPVLEETYAEPAPVLSELLLPTGMQDMATYMRLLELPNPLTGIVITISVNDFAKLTTTVSPQDMPALLGSVDTLMHSMVREGDFGVKVADDQWMFVYRLDDNGMAQRRVGGLSEKLWDFQLRHLGLSNLSFSWAAVNVHSERMIDAVNAAIERMENSRRGTKKAGANDRARMVVNG